MRVFPSRRRVLLILAPLYLAIAYALSALASCSCIECWHEGPWHFVGKPPAADRVFAHDLSCAAAYTHQLHPDPADSLHAVEYTDVLDSLVHTWVQVQGSAIRSGSDYARAYGASAQYRPDTILIVDDYWNDEATIASEEMHPLQDRHHELYGPSGAEEYPTLLAELCALRTRGG